MSRFGKLRIEGVEYDLDDLDLNEIEEIENQAGGVPFSEINYGAAKGMKAFAYVLMRRSNPEITMDEVGKVKIVAFDTPDEEMPDLPPVPSATLKAVEEQSGSVADDSGVQDSPVSTAG